VFSEGSVAAGRAAVQVEAARVAEHQAFDADEATLRRLEAYAIGGAAGLSGLILAILGVARVSKRHGESETASATSPMAREEEDELLLRESSASPVRNVTPPPAPPSPTPPAVAPVLAPSAAALKTAADVCTELGRIHDLANLRVLLGRAARVMDANGLVVWLGSPTGGDLQPVAAHGYGDQVLSLMRPVPRTADNAAAAAYRSGTLQTVASRAGAPLGAVVAPLLSADGCIGALTAEVNNGVEKSEQVQALASIFAAQLAAILSATAAGPVSETRTAIG